MKKWETDFKLQFYSDFKLRIQKIRSCSILNQRKVLVLIFIFISSLISILHLSFSFYHYSFIKFIYSEKATKFCEISSSYILRRPQNFAKSPPIIWLAVRRTNNWWRFHKILWPSQNIWTLNLYFLNV